jgi:hypothetical protein
MRKSSEGVMVDEPQTPFMIKLERETKTTAVKIRLLVYPDPDGAKTDPEPTEDRLGRIGGQRRGRNLKEQPQLKNILALFVKF